MGIMALKTPLQLLKLLAANYYGDAVYKFTLSDGSYTSSVVAGGNSSGSNCGKCKI